MYTEHEYDMDGEALFYEPSERTSDIQLPPVMNVLLLTVWIVISLIGLAVILFGKNTVAGAIMIAVPTFIGMIIKPTFALCIMMLVLPTGAGVTFGESISLDRGVGIALAVSFFMNWIITRPRLRIGHTALWVMGLYTVWICLASLGGTYLNHELIRAFTQVQLLVLILIVYWILQTNGEAAFLWASRAYVIGTLGTIALTFITGSAGRSMAEAPEQRYSATLGEATDANMLATLIAIAFLASIYLFARDRKFLWRMLYLVAIVVLPVMLLKIGSRGGLIALFITMLSPLLFIRQVARRPALAALLLFVILLGTVSAVLVVRGSGLEAPVATRLTNLQQAEEAIDTRMMPIEQALKCVAENPIGTSFYGWFEKSNLTILPHNDFFFALGVYGVPGAVLFTWFVILVMLTVKRMPLGLEKLYARAILTYLLVMGLNVGQLYQKHYWIFLGFVLASERMANFFTVTEEELYAYDEYDDEFVPQEQFA